MSFVPVSDAVRAWFGLTAETVHAYEVGAAAAGSGGPGLFGEIVIPVTLVGTSYSGDPRWAFEDALRLELGLDVLNVAAEGEGPFEPMREYLRSEAISEVSPDLVVWEIPERYLTLP